MSRGSPQYPFDDPSQNNRRQHAGGGPGHQQPQQWQPYVPYPSTAADPLSPPSASNYPTSPTTYGFPGYVSPTYTPPHNYGSFQGPMPSFDPNSTSMIAQGSTYPPYNQPEQSPASPPLYQTGPASNPAPQTSPTLTRPPRLQQAHSQPAYQGMLFHTPVSSTLNYHNFAPSPFQQSYTLGPFQQPMQQAYQQQSTYPTFQVSDSDSGQQQQPQQQPQGPLQLPPQQQQGGWWYHPAPPLTAPTLAQVQAPFAMGYAGFMSPPPQDIGFGMMQARSPGGQPFFNPQPTGRASPGPGMTRAYSLPVSNGPSGSADPSRPAPSRKSYHPRAPQNRSEWVMWAGNVPADATQEELWALFTRPPSPVPPNSVPAAFGDDNPGGVTSLHLIARSNCAFVNFTTHEALLTAVRRFDGRPARSEDPRCPRLVCRVRRREDDLRAGVGGQRGTGVHSRWVKDNVPTGERGKQTPGATDVQGRIRAMSISAAQPDHGPDRARHQSSGSDSYASTNSSLLGHHFPQRYFILKSLSQSDLELSVETGLWATQSHNEEVLDRAFRTATDVFLIFGVNKSGEFFGYARMAGPIRGERRVSWASTSSSQAIPASGDEVDNDDAPVDAGPNESSALSHSARGETTLIFSPSEHRMASSPQPLSSRGITNGLDPGDMGGLLGPAGAALDRDRLFVRQHTATEPKPLSPNASAVSESSIASAPAATELGAVKPIIAPDSEDDELTPPGTEPVDVLAKAEQAAGEVMPPHAAIKDVLNANAPVINLDHHAPAAATRAGRTTTPALRPIQEVITPPEEEPRRKSAPAHMPDLEITGIDDSSPHAEDSNGVKRLDTLELEQRRGSEPGTGPQRDAATSPSGAGPSSGGNPWGSSFKVEWIKTERLPFWRTRNLRNPWNQDREVKVSRDGTELEPSVGQRLLEEWDSPAPPAPPLSPQASRRSRAPAATAANRTPASKPAPSNSGGAAHPSAAMLGAPLRRSDTRPP